MAKRTTYQTVLLISTSDVKPYGVMTEYGAIWEASVDAIVRKLRFVFDVKAVEFTDRRLTNLRSER